MRPRDFAHSLQIGLIVFGLLAGAGGRAHAAAIGTLPSAPTSAPSATGWLGRELDPIIIQGSWSSVVRVWVRGQAGLPVTISAADGGWSTVNFAGSKTEYGPDALEFAPVWPGRYLISPEGLGTSLTIDLAPGRIAQVLFEMGDASMATPTPTITPSPALTPTSISTTTPASRVPTSIVPTTLAPAPRLIEPLDGTAVSIKARLDLTWAWDETLGSNDFFQVEIWNNYNDFSTPIDVAWVKTFTYKYDSNPNPAYGVEYRWRITAIRGIPAREKDWSTPENRVWDPVGHPIQVSQESPTWTLIIDPGCPPGDRSC
jgi:hypothetical protein